MLVLPSYIQDSYLTEFELYLQNILTDNPIKHFFYRIPDCVLTILLGFQSTFIKINIDM